MLFITCFLSLLLLQLINGRHKTDQNFSQLGLECCDDQFEQAFVKDYYHTAYNNNGKVKKDEREKENGHGIKMKIK